MLTIVKNIVFIITPEKKLSPQIYTSHSSCFFFFFFSLNTPDNFTCRGFLISKTPGFNKISRAYSMVEGLKIVH